MHAIAAVPYRPWLVVLAGAVVAFQLAVFAGVVGSMASTRRMQDFALFYSDAGRAIVKGQNPYARQPAQGAAEAHVRINLNPPHFLLLLAPLVALDPLPAFVVWITLGLISAAAAIHLILRENGLRFRSPTGMAVVGAVIATAPTGALLLSGQVSWLLWWPACRAWVASRRGQWIAAGALLGVLASLKPFLLVFLPFLAVARRWGAFVTLIVTAGVCNLVGLVAFGWPTFYSWLVGLGSITWSKSVLNASIFGVLERGLSDRLAPGWDLAPVTHAPALVYPLWLSAVAVVFGASVLTVRQSRGGDREADYVFALGLTAALLVSPVGWIYYHFLFVGPVLALVRKEQWWTISSVRRVLLLGFAGPLLCAPGMLAAWQPNGWLSLTLGSLYFWSLLALWVCIVLPVFRPAVRDRGRQ